MRLAKPADLHVDGAHGEGGGQLVRTAVALAAITGTALHLANVRAARHPAGLAPQHLAAVPAVAALCGARCEGLELRSTAFDFVPGPLGGGEFAFDVGTAGSATLVLQALLPAMIRASRPCRVRVTGGTDVRAAPPLDYFRRVLLPLVKKMGIEAACTVRRRGYYPRGGGEVEVAVAPATPRPLSLTSPGKLLCVEGLAHAANLPAHIPERMREAALTRLGKVHVPVAIEQEVLGSGEALGQGGAIVLWARTEHGVLGAGRVAERGVRAEVLGEAVAGELAAELEAGAALDVHAADQLLVYLALAEPGSVVAVREVSRHAETAMWLIEQFLPTRFSVTDAEGLKRIEMLPA
jgi:RNA 3'-phosphate cyclase